MRSMNWEPWCRTRRRSHQGPDFLEDERQRHQHQAEAGAHDAELKAIDDRLNVLDGFTQLPRKLTKNPATAT